MAVLGHERFFLSNFCVLLKLWYSFQEWLLPLTRKYRNKGWKESSGIHPWICIFWDKNIYYLTLLLSIDERNGVRVTVSMHVQGECIVHILHQEKSTSSMTYICKGIVFAVGLYGRGRKQVEGGCNRTPRKSFRPMCLEVKRSYIKFNYEELCNLSSSPNIIIMMK